MDEETIRTIIYALLILMLPINLFATYKLLKMSHLYDGKISALSERATVAAILTASVMLGAVFAIARFTGHLAAPNVVSILLIGSAILLAGLPAVFWAWRYRQDGFRD